MPPLIRSKTASVFSLLRRPGVSVGMMGCVLAHTGQYALFTYIRPALEGLAQVDAEGLALLLLGFGLANFCGTLSAGWLMERSLRLTLIMMPRSGGCSRTGHDHHATIDSGAHDAGDAVGPGIWRRTGGVVELGCTDASR